MCIKKSVKLVCLFQKNVFLKEKIKALLRNWCSCDLIQKWLVKHGLFYVFSAIKNFIFQRLNMSGTNFCPTESNYLKLRTSTRKLIYTSLIFLFQKLYRKGFYFCQVHLLFNSFVLQFFLQQMYRFPFCCNYYFILFSSNFAFAKPGIMRKYLEIRVNPCQPGWKLEYNGSDCCCIHSWKMNDIDYFLWNLLLLIVGRQIWKGW